MTTQAYKITVPRTAHYYTLGNLNADTKTIWICCHGYGQAAASFIRKFDVVVDKNTFVIAPEALSKFYWGGFTGDVVASWMTKGDRLDEIADFCNYMQTIYDLVTKDLNDNVTINLFGFSQGVATIIRWIFAKQPRFNNLILWAGTIPDELDYTPFHGYLKNKNTQFLYGTEDELLTPERLVFLRKLAAKKGMQWEETSYVGKHLVYRKPLKLLANKIKINK